MKYLLKLALKNILKAKRRTILTFLMLSFGVLIYLIMEGMLEGFDVVSFENYINFETGHFKIRSPKFDKDHPYDTDNFLSDTASIEEKLKQFKFITGFTPRINFLSELDNGIDSTPVITKGIDPEKDNSVFNLDKYIVNGKLEKESMVIGSTLAKDMGVKTGDYAFITFKDQEGMFTSIELAVSGIIQSEDPIVNSSTVFLNIDEVRKNMAISGATDISVKVDDVKKTDSYYKLLKTEFKDLNVQSWKELSTDFSSLIATKRSGTRVLLLFIVIIALVGIINTLLMSVYEKRREIGTLMALGMEHREIRNIFMIEGVLIGFFGCLLGLILGTLANLYFIYVGIDYSALVGNDSMGLNVMGAVKSVWVFSTYLSSLIIILAAGIISSYYPAKKVMRMEPAVCLRTVQ